MTSPITPGRAQIVGTGLIGGSIGSALRRRGWWVTGRDADPCRATRAQALGALDAVGDDGAASLVFVATPAGAVVAEASAALAGTAVVTDVAGVKRSIVEQLGHPRFVGGHPMAGSEQDGVEGADPDLFEGATWVLTPSEVTDPHAYTTVRSVVGSLGASVVAVPAARHDELVAVVSHVPHLTAATLMNVAARAATDHATLLRLAAGGFRDMTRVAAGHPGIWPDVCVENRESIVAVLDTLRDALAQVRSIVADGDRDALLRVLEAARDERVNLPVRVARSKRSVEVRVPVPDRPGVLAEVTTALGEVAVDIHDLEIAHSAEGAQGVLVLVVDEDAVPAVRTALSARHYRLSTRAIVA